MSKRAWLALRHTTDKRYQLFSQGLARHGYKTVDGLPGRWRDGDILVTWNRLAVANKIASKFEKQGLSVLVAENASFGNAFAGRRWFHIARWRHNTAGMFTCYDTAERWDSLGVELPSFRGSGGETVILPQRGIGAPPTAMPRGWQLKAHKKYGGRIRSHPGKRKVLPLDKDLAEASRVITWGSGAAIQALLMGVPVLSEMPEWIGEQDNTESGRLAMFRRLVWAQWTHDEIADGYAFECLLKSTAYSTR